MASKATSDGFSPRMGEPEYVGTNLSKSSRTFFIKKVVGIVAT